MTELQETVDRRVELLAEGDVPRRIWAGDHTVWRPDPTEIVDRLGWLTVHEEMRGLAQDLREFARGCANDGLKTAVLAGMGGSSLAPEVFRESLGVTQGFLDLVVLDTTHPDQVLAVERSLDLSRTLFVVASKSGNTIETRSHLEYFWRRLPVGAHFAAITDPGSPLEDLAGERGFRRTFLSRPDIGGRYSALSMFGLVPAALVGAELERCAARRFRPPTTPRSTWGRGWGRRSWPDGTSSRWCSPTRWPRSGGGPNSSWPSPPGRRAPGSSPSRESPWAHPGCTGRTGCS
ncbi:MAG: hypothetical protein HYU54_08940 [Actinobacteria bacterium]|nr:hypothetical protein [Actinomycetota bacterium]